MNAMDIDMTSTFPLAPFLLTTVRKDGGKTHFAVEEWEGHNIEVSGNGQFIQSFTWTTHKATEEEIKKFMEEGDKDASD